MLLKLWREFTADDKCVGLPLHRNAATVMARNRRVSKVFSAVRRRLCVRSRRQVLLLTYMTSLATAVYQCISDCFYCGFFYFYTDGRYGLRTLPVRAMWNLSLLGHFGVALFACHFCNLTAVCRLCNFESCKCATVLRGAKSDQHKIFANWANKT